MLDGRSPGHPKGSPRPAVGMDHTPGFRVQLTGLVQRLSAHRTAHQRRREARKGEGLGVEGRATGCPRLRLGLQQVEPHLQEGKELVRLVVLGGQSAAHLAPPGQQGQALQRPSGAVWAPAVVGHLQHGQLSPPPLPANAQAGSDIEDAAIPLLAGPGTAHHRRHPAVAGGEETNDAAGLSHVDAANDDGVLARLAHSPSRARATLK